MAQLFFIFPKENIQGGVKQETSLLAERRTPSQPPPQGEGLREMLDELVMDEEYDTLFKRLFNQAHAEVIKYIPPKFLRDTPTDLTPVFREYPDFRQDRDFSLWLEASEEFVLQYRKSIDIKIEQFLIDYIVWRWLETKSPVDAHTYFLRLEPTMLDVVRLLTRSSEPIRRLPSFP